MFAYCENNPINRADPTGHSWIVAVIIAAISTIALSGCSSENSSSSPPYDYIECTNNRNNCYQYALSYAGIKTPDCFVDPGYKYINGGVNNSLYSIYDLKDSVEKDLNILGIKYSSYYNYSQIGSIPKGCVLIAGYTIPSQHWFFGDYTDYHFAVRLSDGSWADKPGEKDSRYNMLFFDENVWTDANGKLSGTAANTVFFVIYE